MTFDHALIAGACVTSLLACAAVIGLSIRVDRLWQGKNDRSAVEAVKSDRTEPYLFS